MVTAARPGQVRNRADDQDGVDDSDAGAGDHLGDAVEVLVLS